MKINGIPCCFYPTTVLFIDDDEDFLHVLKRNMSSPYQLFKSPFAAIDYLEKVARFTKLEEDSLLGQESFDANERNFVVDITKIHQRVYDSKRIEEVSVIVVDYQMPGMNGLEFCKRVKHYNVKIVMLTGEAGLELATDAFNHGIIDKFIRKNAADLYKELPKAIEEMQFKHFQEASYFLIDSLSNSSSSGFSNFLQSENFATFFRKLLQENNITEYYLLDSFGHFLMRNQQGESLYCMVQDEAMLNAFIRDAEIKYREEPDEEAKEVLSLIQKKEQMPFLYCLNDAMDFSSWHQYMQPLKSEVYNGVNYYYAIIKNDPYNRRIH